MKCNLCQRESDNYLIDVTTGSPIIFCANCYSKLNTCYTCINRDKCDFETDTSCTEPKVVMQTIKQGSMVIQQQINNPNRIKQTCALACPCYNEKCNKEDMYCPNYQEIPIFPIE